MARTRSRASSVSDGHGRRPQHPSPADGGPRGRATSADATERRRVAGDARVSATRRVVEELRSAHERSETTEPRPAAEPGLRVVYLAAGHLHEGEGEEALEEAALAADAKIWVDLTGATDERVAAVTRLLGLHELIAEDILEGNQRAKIEVTDDLIHIVLFALNEARTDSKPCEIDVVLGSGFLLTVHDPDWNPRHVNAFRSGLEPMLERGLDHLLWALVDDIVDGYFPFIDRLGDEIDDVQDRVLASASPQALERLLDLKRRLFVVRRAAAPIREIFNQLTNRDLDLIDEEEVIYFRDVYDHLIRLTDELDSYRELVAGTLDVYLSTVNNNLSLIMKRLTGVTVVLTGIAAIAGIFGMSEAGTALGGGEAIGFWLVTLFTIGAALLMAAVLRRINWI
jgi:magnesium transporter